MFIIILILIEIIILFLIEFIYESDNFVQIYLQIIKNILAWKFRILDHILIFFMHPLNILNELHLKNAKYWLGLLLYS